MSSNSCRNGVPSAFRRNPVNRSPSDAPPLAFTFLGPPEVLRGGVRVAGGRFDRPLALLAYLAAHPGPREREELASLLWPGKPSASARGNLSTNLHYLERRIGEGFSLEKTPRTVGWIDQHPPWASEPVDLRRYLRDDPPEGCAVLHPPEDCAACRERAETQREMGRRIFLEEVSFEGMGAYGEWVKAFRLGLARRQEEIERRLAGESTSPGRAFSVSLPEWEIRQTTFLSVLLSPPAGMEPEEAVGLRESFREEMEKRVLTAGGRPLAGSEGAFLAVFGFPRAREDEARRAVGTAHALRASVASDPRFKGCAVRLGLHAGEGISDRGGEAPDPLGDRIREATRVARHGTPGEIAATYETASRVDRWYAVAQSGTLPKGADGPERLLYRIRKEPPLGPSPAATLFGRQREQARMRDLWTAAKAERSLRILWLAGEAGIGKSALIEGLASRIHAGGAEDGSVRLISCLPEHRESPYASLIRFLSGAVGLEKNLSPLEYRYRLERYLLSTGQPVREHLPALLHLLDAPGAAWGDLSPPEHPKEGIESLVLSILTCRSERPFLLVIDDLHWMDLATLELLRKALEALKSRPVLVVVTARREESLREVGLPPPDETMRLAGLSRAESRQMVESLARGVPLSPKAVREGVDRGGGVPLFLRELVLSGALSREGGSGVPQTLRDLLTSRIDALEESRPMAKVAACLGLSLEGPVLLRAAERYARLASDSGTAEAWIRELVDCEILELDRPPPSPVYRFRHDLLREAVLQSLPASVRRGIHRSIAQTLREDFSERVESTPEILAEHLMGADVPEEALPLFVRAGERAEGVGAYEIALSHYGRALDLLAGEHGGPDAPSTAIRILRRMIRIALYVWGHGSTRIDALLGKLSELAERGTPEGRKIFDHLHDAVRFGIRGPTFLIERFGEPEALERAAGGSGGTRLWLACMRGIAFSYNGQLSRAYDTLQDLLPQIRSIRWDGQGIVESFSEPPAVLLFSYLGFVGQLAGRTKESLAFLAEGEGREECGRFPKSRVYVGVHKIFMAWMRENVEKAEMFARETVLLADAHDLHMGAELCRLALAWCRGTKESEAQAEAAEKAVRAMIPGVGTIYIAIHAGAAFRAALWEKAVGLARFGRDEGRRTGTHVFDPHLLTLEGRALLAMDSRKNREEARALFEDAIRKARRSGAVWYGIQAAMALAAIEPTGRKLLRGFLASLPEEEDSEMVREAREVARETHPPEP